MNCSTVLLLTADSLMSYCGEQGLGLFTAPVGQVSRSVTTSRSHTCALQTAVNKVSSTDEAPGGCSHRDVMWKLSVTSSGCYDVDQSFRCVTKL